MNIDLSAHIEEDLRLHSWEATTAVDSRLRDEQARLIWSHSYLMMALGLGVGAALVAAQWPVLPHDVLGLWSLLLVAVSAAWAGVAMRYRRIRTTAGIGGRWMQYAVIAVLAYGLVWSAAALLLFPHGILVHQAILTVMLAGISAGAVATLSSVSATGTLVIVPALLPLAYKFALVRSTPALLILAMLLVLMLTLLIANRHLYHALRKALRLWIEKTLSEAALHESETRYRLLFHHIPLGVLHYDVNGTILDCNDMSTEVLGAGRKAIVGRNVITEANDPDMAAAASTSLDSGWGYYEGRYEWLGGTRAVTLRAFFNAVERADQSVLGGIAILEDFTARKSAEEATHRMAYYDPLTDLANRRLLDDRLQQALAAAKRHLRFGALAFLDIDSFKRINDWIGHGGGDEVLRTVAARLENAVRAEDTAGRMSGDEFILLLPELGASHAAAERSAEAVCAKVQAAIQKPISIQGHAIRVTVSVGVTVFPQGDATAEEMLRRSDTAMYRAKQAVRGEIRMYEPQSDELTGAQAEFEQDLGFALEREEFFLEYQPVMNTRGELVGAEALLRWMHPDYGTIAPGQFICLAEDSGLIVPIGRWALEQACLRLNEVDPTVLPCISVNVSPREFRHRDFVDHVLDCITRMGTDPGRIILEVTENVLIDHLEETVEKMGRLRQQGIRFEVDDFGTGYSSMTYLKRLPIDGVKIDRSFVANVDGNGDDRAIVEAIIAIARRLDLYVVGEGIERASQFEYLRGHGCDRLQGFYWGPPTRFEDFLQAWAGRTAARPATAEVVNEQDPAK